MAKDTIGQPLPPIPSGFQMPFYYGSLTNCEVIYLVDPAATARFLNGTGLAPAIFNGKACASYNYQLYTAQFSGGAAITQEIELNIVAYPVELAAITAQVTFEQFVAGDDQSKLLGHHRVWVPCDSDLAIKAGKELFGQPKFKTSFTVSIPSLNAPPSQLWNFQCNDPAKPDSAFIFRCQANVEGLPLSASNPSPYTEWGKVEGRLIGCRWNILSPFQTYSVPAAKKAVQLTFGSSSHPMRKDIEELIGTTAASVVRTYQSPPAAIQARAWYPVRGVGK